MSIGSLAHLQQRSGDQAFLEVAGEPIESLSTTPLAFPSTPEFPAEKVMTMSRLVQMKESVLALSTV